MKEPLSLRVSDAEDPKRRTKFEAVLTRKRANASDVIRGLIDAYIESDGLVDFPVELKQKPCADGRGCPPLLVLRGRDGDGDGEMKDGSPRRRRTVKAAR